MKKIYILPFLISMFTTMAFANNADLEQLNLNIKNVLAPFQNSTTVAKIKFNKLDTNDTRVLTASIESHAQKIGPNNRVDLKIKNLEYNYNDGLKPQILFSGVFGFDFTKLKTSQEINDKINEAAQNILDFTKAPNIPDLGNALTISSAITAVEKDSKGNKIGLTALILAKVNFDKLPSETNIEDVDFDEISLSVSVNAKNSSEMHGYININPNADLFKESELDFKNMVQALVDNEPKATMLISYVVTILNGFANELLDGNLISNNFFSSIKTKL